ncbi:MAG: antibiotic biosynthesis monooxygenase [Desulfobacterium sp.]|jgi:heme-degrading monooxygenase HmoA|nr:antibiotic biosynthesis monooxygenase [Desulfobacterium sp.]
MFIALISFPPIKAGKDAEFREWFTTTNGLFSKSKGFIGRRLLEPIEEGNYAAIVEFESQETFKAMHASSAHDKAAERVMPLFDGTPTPLFYQLVTG